MRALAPELTKYKPNLTQKPGPQRGETTQPADMFLPGAMPYLAGRGPGRSGFLPEARSYRARSCVQIKESNSDGKDPPHRSRPRNRYDMQFTKMHGLGNDFLVTEEYDADLGAAARELCPRRTSVGADGLIAVCPSDTADIRMRIFNADGSEAEMCGNGIRCFARYVHDRGLVEDRSMRVETEAGIMQPELLEDGRVRVDMGRPDFQADRVPVRAEDAQSFTISLGDGSELEGAAVLMGVPHAALFQDTFDGPLDEADIARIGPAIETHPMFPRKINVNFVEITGPDTLRVRTWERGAGRTMACGTGSCASAVLAHKKGITGNKVTVQLDAGELEIEIANDGRVYMTGPAAYVYDGTTNAERLT